MLLYYLQALTRKEEDEVGQHREHSQWHSNMSVPMSKSLPKWERYTWGERGDQALTATMLRLGHTIAKVLGTSSLRAGSGVSVTHCDALSQGTGVNCWEYQMRRVNDEPKEISVLLLNPLITWATPWEQKTLMLSSFSSRWLIILYIFIYFSV